MEFGEKTSNKRQWRERSERPIAAKPMTKTEILHFQNVLMQSYKCDDPADITYDFEKILDENDEDRDDCLFLVYRMKQIDKNGKPSYRPVFRTRLPIPEDIRMKAEQMRAQMFQGTHRALPPATTPTYVHLQLTAPITPVVPPSDVSATPSMPKTKLKRTIRRVK